MAKNALDMFTDVEEDRFGGTDRTLDTDKLRGALLKFVKEADTIEGSNGSGKYNIVWSRFYDYMRDNVDGWSKFVSRMLDDVDKESFLKEFNLNNSEFRHHVNTKIRYTDEVEEDGESSHAGGGGSGGSGDGTLDEFAEKCGTTESAHDDMVEDSGIDNSDSNNSLDDYDNADTDNGDGGDSSGSGNNNDNNVSRGDEDERESGKQSGGDGGDGSGEEGQQGLGGWGEDDTEEVAKQSKEIAKKVGTVESEDRYDIEDIRNDVIHGNSYEELKKLPTNAIDTVFSSPPYFNQRDYGDETNTSLGDWDGQLGQEPTPDMFAKHIYEIFGDRMRRPLKPTGSVFVNVWDKYAGSGSGIESGVREKSMYGTTYRFAIKMIDNGWIQRQEIIWAKQVIDEDDNTEGNAMPTQVKDRINDAHEHIFWYTPEKEYHSILDDVRRRHKTEASSQGSSGGSSKFDEAEEINKGQSPAASGSDSYYHDKGGNIPDVWQINPGNSQHSHFAVFSEELPKRAIQMTCPKEVCADCGKPWGWFVETTEKVEYYRNPDMRDAYDKNSDADTVEKWKAPTCTCGTEETNNGIVLDPFAGRGTTLKVAADLGYDYVGIELNGDNLDIIDEYVPDSKQQDLGKWE